MVKVEHLSKKIGKQTILNDISFQIGDGEVVALLGPNGAGKSTLMKTLVGLWEPTSGSVTVPTTHGYLPELNPLYDEMFVREYLRFMLDMENRHLPYSRVEELIEQVGLTPEANKKIGQLSKGYKQRVGLAQALLGDPELLILDEPTTGLDPNQLVDIRNLIRQLGQNRTVILSTHILEEVKYMCSRVLILNHGVLRADRSMSEVDEIEQLFYTCTHD